jgi:signal transduction histidine kinase/DNA-binding NarL/FixJ family response regulator
VDQPFVKIGERALDLIVARVRGEQISLTTVIPSVPVIRRSCGCTLYDRFIEGNRISPEKEGSRCASFALARIDPVSLQEHARSLAEDFPQSVDRESTREWIRFLVSSIDPTSKTWKGRRFMEALESAVLAGFESDVGIDVWKLVCKKFFSLISGFVTDSEAFSSIESFYNHALLFIHSMEEFQVSDSMVRNQSDKGLVELFKMTLSGTHDFNGIKSVFESFLPRFAFTTCKIMLYSDEPANDSIASVFFSYPSLADRSENPTFPCRAIDPDITELKKARTLLLTVFPLSHNEEHFGFTIFESGKYESIICEQIAMQLSIAVQTARLFETVKLHATKLEAEVRSRTEELHKEIKAKEIAYIELDSRKNEVEALYEELRAAAEEKTSFFINLAHETKTPLTIISNYLESYMHDKPHDEMLVTIKRNFDKFLKDMVNYLDSEKLERGQVFYDNDQLTDISELMRERVASFAIIAGKKKISLTSRIDPSLVVRADPSAIDRIAFNLIDNALRYTDTGGRVEVACIGEGRNAIVSVRDSGMGIPGDQLANIFKPYYQVSHQKRNIQGIGMGLSIVKKIADSLGARINVTSKEGKGSSFSISFPMKFPEVSCNTAFKNDGSIPIPGNESTAACLEDEIRNGRQTILIVDDNEDMLRFLHDFLKDSYNVICARSGEEAMRKIDTLKNPDLVISDIMMDDMDGLGLLREIVTKPEHSHVPVIFLTALSTMKDKQKGLSGGAIDYITKPFDVTELRLKIESIMRSRKMIGAFESDAIKNRIRKIVDKMRMEDQPDKKPAAIRAIMERFCLSAREYEVLLLVSEGRTNKEICSRIGISVKTVETHIHNTYAKCGVHNRIELINLIDRFVNL